MQMENKRPTVSVIVPVYRAEEYLNRCVDSILAQTFTDFEVILVDDGSPDSCGEICDDYARRDPRVRAFHKENGGVSSARNMGLNHAQGEWIAFVDADDWVLSHYLETILVGKDTDIIITNEFSIGFIDKKKAIKNLLRKNWHSCPWGKFFRKSLFDSHTFDIPRTITNGEDMIMNFRLFNKTNNKIIVLPISEYKYFINKDGASLTFKNSWEYRNFYFDCLCKYVDWRANKYEIIHFCIESIKYLYAQRRLIDTSNTYTERISSLIAKETDSCFQFRMPKPQHYRHYIWELKIIRLKNIVQDFTLSSPPIRYLCRQLVKYKYARI